MLRGVAPTAAFLATLLLAGLAGAQSQRTQSQNPKPSGVTKGTPSKNGQQSREGDIAQDASRSSPASIQNAQPEPFDPAAQKRQEHEEEHLKIDRETSDAAVRSAKAAEDLVVSTNGLIKATDNLVGVTWVLVIVGAIGSFLLIGQLYYLRKSVIDTGISVGLARDEFAAAHRPRIAVRGIAWQASGQTTTISLQCVNIGDNMGWITEIHYALIIMGSEPPSDPDLVKKNTGRIEIAVGQRKAFGFDSPAFSEMLRIAMDHPPSVMDQTAYLVGRIIYTDKADRLREMGFCRVTQGTSRRWAVVRDSEHEYCD